MKFSFRRATLSNGLTLLLEHHPQVRSVCVGVWVRVGSRNEKPHQNGLSHLIEHMAFKGTSKHTAKEVSVGLECLGGELNAFTDREVTCFHASLLAEDIELALSVLGGLVTSPQFPEDELVRERKVLLQELSSIEDSPEDRLYDIFLRNTWKKSALGQSVMGRKEVIVGTKRKALLEYFHSHYRPDNMVVSIAGNFDSEKVVDLCEREFVFEKRESLLKKTQNPPKFHSGGRHVSAPTDQTQLLLGFEGIPQQSRARYAAICLSVYLGGGMSSRLFQEIREKAGLCYSVDCDTVSYSDGGLIVFSLATSPRFLSKCAQILASEIKRVSTVPLTRDELNAVKGQIRGGILMASDEMEYRQESLARNQLFLGRVIPVEETVSEIEKVKAEEILEVAKSSFVAGRTSLYTLGKTPPKSRPSVC